MNRPLQHNANTSAVYEGNMYIYVRTYERNLAHDYSTKLNAYICGHSKIRTDEARASLPLDVSRQHAPFSQLLLGIHAQDSHRTTANAEKLQYCATRGLTSGQCSWIKWRIGPTNSCLYMTGRTRPSFSTDKQHTTGEGNDSISATGN